MQTWLWISYCQHSVSWNGTQLAYLVASSFCYRQFTMIWVSHYRDACEQLMTYSRLRGISSALFGDINVPSYLAPSLFFSCRLANWKNSQCLRKVSHIMGEPITFASLGKSVSQGDALLQPRLTFFVPLLFLPTLLPACRLCPSTAALTDPC